MGSIADWWPAIEPWFKSLLLAGTGFLAGTWRERWKARQQLRSQAMADVTEALNRVEGIAGDLKVRLSIVFVDDNIVISKGLSVEERTRLEEELSQLRNLAGRLARFPELSKAVEEMAEKAAFVLHLGDALEHSGIESGQVTSARRDLDDLFNNVVRAKDQAVKSIL